MATKRKSTLFRVTGLPTDQTDIQLLSALKNLIDQSLSEEERPQIETNVAHLPSCQNDGQMSVALVDFIGRVPHFLSDLIANPLGDWQIEMDYMDITFDCHFFGFTQLYAIKPGNTVIAE